MNIPSNIFGFQDYREFLKDRYQQLKRVDDAFSFRTFSKEAGFGSPNYLKLVMDGKRNVSEEAVEKFAKGLRLDNHESEYFKYLVASNQCADEQKKRVFESKLSYLKELFKVKEHIPELYGYYHDWYHAAIRGLIQKGGVKNKPAEIARALVPAITSEQAKASVELLKRLQFVSENDVGELSALSDINEMDIHSSGMVEKIYQEQMAELAAQSIYTQDSNSQGFESVTLSLPPEQVAELKARIRDWARDLSQDAGKGDKGGVYQLNIQLFALTKGSEEDAA